MTYRRFLRFRQQSPALGTLAARYRDYLAAPLAVEFGDICFTANCGRVAFKHRLAIVANSRCEAEAALGQYLAEERVSSNRRFSSEPPGHVDTALDALLGDIQTLSTAARRSLFRWCSGELFEEQILPRLNLSSAGEDRSSVDVGELETLLTMLARLFVLGVDVDWLAHYPTGRRVPLPTYPFQRKSYWLSAGQRKRSKAARLKSAFAVAPRSVAAPAPEATPQSEIAGWFYEPRWQESPRGPQRELPPGSWLVLATQNPLDEALCRRLEARGLSLLVAQPGPRFSGINWTSTGRGTLSLAAGEEADFRQLAAALADVRLAGVIHLWAQAARIEAEPDLTAAVQQLDTALARGVLTLYQLVRALAGREERLEWWLVSRGRGLARRRPWRFDPVPWPRSRRRCGAWGRCCRRNIPIGPAAPLTCRWHQTPTPQPWRCWSSKN